MESRFRKLTLIEQVKNFYNSLVRMAKSPKKLVDKEEMIKRVSICDQCPLKKGMRCTVCGCFIKMKASFYTEKCPKENW